MAEVVKMPRLSDTMEEGTVAKWHKKKGDKVEEGDLLAEIETDKATMDFEAFQEGTLLYIGVDEGETAAVESVLCILGEEGEDIEDLKSGDSGQESEGSEEEESGDEDSDEEDSSDEKKEKGDEDDDSDEEDSDEKKSKKKKDEDEDEDSDEEESGEKKSKKKKEEGDEETGDEDSDDSEEDEDSEEDSKKKKEKEERRKQAGEEDDEKSVSDSDSRIKASPLAKKLAKEKGIDIKDVDGSGDGGRIVKEDIENYKPKKKAAKSAGALEEDYEDMNVSQMRKTIAKRLAESKYNAPHFYLTIEIDMDAAFAARKQINEIAASKISFNDIVIKACAAALKQHPQVNSEWKGDKIRKHNLVHIGVAVAVDEGLLVPVIKNADRKGLAQINAEVKEAAEKARSKKLQPDEMEGGTFAVSNLGMFGIEEFTAIINPPNSCIMAVGAMTEKAVVKDGQIVAGKRMKVTMSCDHRTVDGATGAKFLQTFKMMMENPLGMVL